MDKGSFLISLKPLNLKHTLSLLCGSSLYFVVEIIPRVIIDNLWSVKDLFEMLCYVDSSANYRTWDLNLPVSKLTVVELLKSWWSERRQEGSTQSKWPQHFFNT